MVLACDRCHLIGRNKIPIEEIVESSEELRVTFDIPFTVERDDDRMKCIDCVNKRTCLLRKLCDEYSYACKIWI